MTIESNESDYNLRNESIQQTLENDSDFIKIKEATLSAIHKHLPASIQVIADIMNHGEHEHNRLNAAKHILSLAEIGSTSKSFKVEGPVQLNISPEQLGKISDAERLLGGE